MRDGRPFKSSFSRRRNQIFPNKHDEAGRVRFDGGQLVDAPLAETRTPFATLDSRFRENDGFGDVEEAGSRTCEAVVRAATAGILSS